MNVMAIYDTNLNILPDKKEGKGANKIDGFMAELCGYIALLRHEDEYKAILT
jgi:phage terminase large subunit-like protein